MQPLHITAEMSEPVVYYDDGMHFDGILAFAVFADLSPEVRAAVPPITEPWALDFDLPLERWEVATEAQPYVDDRLFVGEPVLDESTGMKRGVMWGWCASCVWADWLCSDRYAIRKRPDMEQMIRYTESPSLNLGAGQLKATNLELPARFALRLHWFAHGELEEVQRLLGHVRAIGKAANKGPGVVKQWLVEPWPVDWSVKRIEQLTRNMPLGVGIDGFVAEAPIRAPYHHRSRFTMAVRPDLARMTEDSFHAHG